MFHVFVYLFRYHLLSKLTPHVSNSHIVEGLMLGAVSNVLSTLIRNFSSSWSHCPQAGINPGYCPTLNTTAKSNLGKGFISAYRLQFLIKGRQGTNWRQEPGGRNWSREHQDRLFGDEGEGSSMLIWSSVNERKRKWPSFVTGRLLGTKELQPEGRDAYWWGSHMRQVWNILWQLISFKVTENSLLKGWASLPSHTMPGFILFLHFPPQEQVIVSFLQPTEKFSNILFLSSVAKNLTV